MPPSNNKIEQAKALLASTVSLNEDASNLMGVIVDLARDEVPGMTDLLSANIQKKYGAIQSPTVADLLLTVTAEQYIVRIPKVICKRKKIDPKLADMLDSGSEDAHERYENRHKVPPSVTEFTEHFMPMIRNETMRGNLNTDDIYDIKQASYTLPAAVSAISTINNNQPVNPWLIKKLHKTLKHARDCYVEQVVDGEIGFEENPTGPAENMLIFETARAMSSFLSRIRADDVENFVEQARAVKPDLMPDEIFERMARECAAAQNVPIPSMAMPHIIAASLREHNIFSSEEIEEACAEIEALSKEKTPDISSLQAMDVYKIAVQKSEELAAILGIDLDRKRRR